jgi:hypothetical protein
MGLHIQNLYPFGTVYVCFTYFKPNCDNANSQFEKLGWWKLLYGQTAELMTGDLTTGNEYYTFYADCTDGATWSGPYIRMVSDQVFDQCEFDDTGMTRSVGFRLLDVGDADDYTVQLAPAGFTTQGGLTGIWRADDGGLYYVNQYANSVWWGGLSTDGEFFNGLSFCNVFSGTLSGNAINGTWADVPRGATNNSGNLQLVVTSDSNGTPIAITKAASTGGFSASTWSKVGNTRPAPREIFDVFDKVMKNQNDSTPVWCQDHSLGDNLKPARIYPAVLFGNLSFSELPHVNWLQATGLTYQNFVCVGDPKPDGDLNFDIQVDVNQLPQDWPIGWQTNHGVNQSNFEAKMSSDDPSWRLHCETIMYGGTAECGNDAHFNDPPLLPGWQQMGGNSVLVNGLPLNGQIWYEAVQLDDSTTRIDNLNDLSLDRGRAVRVTGILALDCGHSNWLAAPCHPCSEDDSGEHNQEMHPVMAIDFITATSQENLSGAWADQYGLTYYIRQIESEIWWVALSPPLDCRLGIVFHGTISDTGSIQGTSVFLPLGTEFHPPQFLNCQVSEDKKSLLYSDGTSFLTKLYDRGTPPTRGDSGRRRSKRRGITAPTMKAK